MTVLDKPITLNIPPLQFSTNPPKATLNVAVLLHLHRLRRTGGAGYSWSATGLPTGLSLSAGGVLSGTPTTGTANAIVTLTDSTSHHP